MPDFISPGRDQYRMCLVQAHQMILATKEPSWFCEHYDSGEGGDQDGHLEQISTRCGVPPELLAVYALALHLSYQIPQGQSASAIRRSLEKVGAHLGKASLSLASVKDESRPKALERQAISECRHPDGSMTIKLEPDLYEEILSVIDRFQQRATSGLGDQADGGPRTFLSYVLSDLVQRFSPPLSIRNQKAVCQDLFDEVRERNEGSLTDFDYEDMLRRI